MSFTEPTVVVPSELGRENLVKVVIALDVTGHSQSLIDNLHRFIKPSQAQITLLYAFPPDSDDKRFNSFEEEVKQETARIVNEEFQKYCDILDARGFKVSRKEFIDHDTPVLDTITDYLEESPPDLLILGMHDKTGEGKRWAAHSTAYRLATHVTCSVLVIKNAGTANANLNVLFATDGSEYADKAAEKLQRFLPTELSQINVFNAVAVHAYALPIVEPYVDYGPLEKALHGEAAELLTRTRTQFESKGYSVSRDTFGLGDPIDQILEEAESQNIDLIVLGSHGTGNRLSKWLLGSVSAKVLETSSASIAILR